MVGSGRGCVPPPLCPRPLDKPNPNGYNPPMEIAILTIVFTVFSASCFLLGYGLGLTSDRRAAKPKTPKATGRRTKTAATA